MSDTRPAHSSDAPSHDVLRADTVAAANGTEPGRLSMGRVVLTVNDLARMAEYYERSIGLHVMRRDGETAELGAGTEVLLELRADPAARRRSPREAGLFHTAFLLPERGDLGRWTRHAIDGQIALTGASDHAVSEALYLNDPEGNGIEIYADRPADSWIWRDGQVDMVTEHLDGDDLLASAAGRPWTGFPEGAVVGHVHLQVGELAPAEAFYHRDLGLDITSRYPGALFMSANGYHHHIATNIWNSRGAGPRSFPSTGLSEVHLKLDEAHAQAIRDRIGAPDTTVIGDPWGTPIVLNINCWKEADAGRWKMGRKLAAGSGQG